MTRTGSYTHAQHRVQDQISLAYGLLDGPTASAPNAPKATCSHSTEVESEYWAGCDDGEHCVNGDGDGERYATPHGPTVRAPNAKAATHKL